MTFLTGMEDYPSYLIKCNYDSKKLDENLPLYYREMLDYFKELHAGHPDIYKFKANLFFGTIKKLQERISLYFGHICLNKESVLYMIYLIKTASFCLLKMYNANIMYT